MAEVVTMMLVVQEEEEGIDRILRHSKPCARGRPFRKASHHHIIIDNAQDSNKQHFPRPNTYTIKSLMAGSLQFRILGQDLPTKDSKLQTAGHHQFGKNRTHYNDDEILIMCIFR